MKHPKISVGKYTPSAIAKYRKDFLKKGIELVDITQLCTFKLGRSGCCNDFNEPNEEIYHIQVHYRDEQIATFNGNNCYPIDEDKYCVFITDIELLWDNDFIIFMKVKV